MTTPETGAWSGPGRRRHLPGRRRRRARPDGRRADRRRPRAGRPPQAARPPGRRRPPARARPAVPAEGRAALDGRRGDRRRPARPVRDLATLHQHFAGLDGDELAERLIRNAARATAGIGAAGGGVAAVEWAVTPTLLSAPGPARRRDRGRGRHRDEADRRAARGRTGSRSRQRHPARGGPDPGVGRPARGQPADPRRRRRRPCWARPPARSCETAAAPVRPQPDHAGAAAHRGGGGRLPQPAGDPQLGEQVREGPAQDEHAALPQRADRSSAGGAEQQRVASSTGRRVLTTQYGVGSAGSSSSTCTAPADPRPLDDEGQRVRRPRPSTSRLPAASSATTSAISAQRQPGVVDPELVAGDRDPDPAQPEQRRHGQRQQHRERKPGA